MGRIEYREAIESARRFDARQKQQAVASSPEVEAQMLNKRRDLMLATGRVFFESIIEGSDLMPMRYLALGQLAAQAVSLSLMPGSASQTDAAYTSQRPYP